MKNINPAEVARRRAQADAARGKASWKLAPEHERVVLLISRHEQIHPNIVLEDLLESAIMAGRGLANLGHLTAIAARAMNAIAQQAAQNAAKDEEKGGDEEGKPREEFRKELLET